MMEKVKEEITFPRVCSNCGQPVQRIGLNGRDYGLIQIELCESCTLIWFDDNESDRLSRAGLVELTSLISTTLQQPRRITAQKTDIHCPACHTRLRRQKIKTLQGYFSRMQCPKQHGYYLTYLSFFAELGYFRPVTWDDINHLSASGKSIHCIQCGAELPHKPQSNCCFCHSPVGILDPNKLARSLDIDSTGWHIPSLQQATFWQSNCPTCGSSVDSVKHLSCPNCQSLLPPKQFESALKAGVLAAKHLPLGGTNVRTPSPFFSLRLRWVLCISITSVFCIWLLDSSPSPTQHNTIWAPEGHCTSLLRMELLGNQLTLRNGKESNTFSRYKTDNVTGRTFFEPQEAGVSLLAGANGSPAFLDISNEKINQKFPFSGLRLTHCTNQEVWTKPALADLTPPSPHITQVMHNPDAFIATEGPYHMANTYLGAWGPEGNCSLRSGVFVEKERVILVHGDDVQILHYAFINNIPDPRSKEEKQGESDDPEVDARLYSPRFPNSISVLMTLARSRSLGGRQFVAVTLMTEPEMKARFPIESQTLDRCPGPL